MNYRMPLFLYSVLHNNAKKGQNQLPILIILSFYCKHV